MEKKYWFVFCGECLLLRRNGDDGYSIPLEENAPTQVREWTYIQELPELDGYQCVAYSVNTPIDITDSMRTVGLRESYALLPREHYIMAGKASQLLYWDSCTKYCGVCGAPMRKNTVISKRCTNCGKEVWPQLAPAIIVRIIRGAESDCKDDQEILLVSAKNFKRHTMFGLVAGFVETGETLEECVRREVLEETGIVVRNIQYFGSQPWPYPSGLMIGFTADYESGELKLQTSELNKGGWFKRNNMPDIPDKLSIARMLIDDWLENG